ncbi:MAG: winged helix-turn-helix transcriptional regulator [Anaerolineales bacterium]|nr:winged helix-turn-helix transcriptional regulator [Anaerolineales bacterium]
MVKNSPHLVWDLGTAYDLFASLQVLHQPDRFGLRGSWAAGVRSRLPALHRQVLEEAQDLFHNPLTWVHGLPVPKDSATALWALSQIPAEERLPKLVLHQDYPKDASDMLCSVAVRQSWTENDLEVLRNAYQQRGWSTRQKGLINALEWWSRADDFGERYLAALQAYHAAFFAEEERRIYPFLEAALQRSQRLAEEMDFPGLEEELTQGVHIATLAEAEEVILTPSYWTSPLVGYAHITAQRMLLLFGARPPEMTLVPGEVVPDALLHSLKAMADPTRLRVLRYLASQPMTPTQLAQQLRLRAPTVIHHLNALRLAGLVQIFLDESGEKRYTIRSGAVANTWEALQKFLG